MTLLEPPTTRSCAFGPVHVDYDDRVLAPRPWTLAQSTWAAELAAGAPPGPVLELCSGAGQIGLAAAALTDRRLVQVDVDGVACAYARANAARAGLAGRVEVRCAPIDAALDGSERFALVVADPPYVPTADVDRYPEDPRLAIDGGIDGMDLVRRCVHVAASHLVAGGTVLLQVGGARQVPALALLAHAAGLSVTESRPYGPTRALVALVADPRFR